MDGVAAVHILDWDESDVHNWLSSLGFPHYESTIREHKIQGDSLCELDSDGLRSLGITSVGHRVSILKSIYQVKLAHNVSIEEHHYIPPCWCTLFVGCAFNNPQLALAEAAERENINVDRLHSVVKDQAQRLRSLEEDNRSLSTTLQSFVDEFNSLRSSLAQTPQDDSSLRRQPSFKWDQFVKPQKSPTKGEPVESPYGSPQRAEHDISGYNRTPGPSNLNSQPPTDKPRNTGEGTSSKPAKQESSDNLKSFKVSLEDPTWKVLPAALKKYRINNDSWQDYAMFICYGSSGNRIERCLSYDEKPLLLFQKLKDAKKNPVFMLKHIKDIRSPIAVAHQKHAARKAASVISNESTATSATLGHHKTGSTSRITHRPPKLEVQDLSATTPTLSTGLSPQPNWPDSNSLSPAADPRIDDAPNSASTQHSMLSVSGMSGSTLVAPGHSPSTMSHDASSSRQRGGDTDLGGGTSARDMPPLGNGISYAVAIYPYMAEQDDEFDVVVGDTFIILSRARGWWVVQRDPTGSGIVDADTAKQGWVPAGCLLETKVPVASAIAEATAAKKGSSSSNSTPGTPASKTPILPLSIISTSFPGIALMDYQKKGDEELDLVKDDLLRVFKRYNHWSYAVKEVGGDRGWVPSWFIGKVSSSGATPATPMSAIPPAPMSAINLEENPTQVSPMSSAFPPLQSRSTTTVI
ncbi:protein kinase regulator [Crepidotus variabilis]|uniref:Protein kinase regulator n=1 Tax=Crepidotus variabilis TaxID=179855 RepID=A0A9P6JS99_9AGAR|nr:protein kinase regulator [Crepidotus variabilis]